MTHRTRLCGLPVFESIIRPNRLGVVFDDVYIVSPRNLENRCHVATLPEKMHGNQGFRSWRNGFFKNIGRNIERLRVNIHHDGLELQQRNNLGRSHVSKSWHNHLVTRFQIQSHQSYL